MWINTTLTSLVVSTHTVIENTATCDDLDTCRSLYSIVQTCILTIFASVWVALHRNIPAPRKRHVRSSSLAARVARCIWNFLSNQRQSVAVFVIALLAPEWILSWALRQAIRAHRLTAELEGARTTALRDWESVRPGAAIPEQDVKVAENGDIDEVVESTDVSSGSTPVDAIPLTRYRSAQTGCHPPKPFILQLDVRKCVHRPLLH